MKQLICFCSACVLIVSIAACGGTKVEPIVVSNSKSINAASKVVASENDWPWWRGPDFNSTATGQDIPLDWNSENTKWKSDVPGEGHASPIVIGNLVVVATSDKSKKTQSLLGFNRTDGEKAWETKIHSGQLPSMHGTNTHASATPASDGNHIYTAFAIDNAIFVSAVDLEGEIVWQEKAGPFQSRHGFGSSPVIYKSLVIVLGDSDGGAFLAALDRESGKIAWRISRPNNGSYCSPMVANIDGKDQLLVSGNQAVNSFDPTTGEQLWQSEGPASTTANTLAWNDSHVFVSGGYPQKGVMAISNDGSGTVAWKNKLKMYVPSPLVVGDKLLVTQDNGAIRLLDTADGEEVWKNRLDSDFYGSPVRSGDTVFIGGRNGKVFAIKVQPEFEVLFENQLDSGISSTPAICGNEVFVRTSNSIYCFASQSTDAKK